jgi:hypothetical protein
VLLLVLGGLAGYGIHRQQQKKYQQQQTVAAPVQAVPAPAIVVDTPAEQEVPETAQTEVKTQGKSASAAAWDRRKMQPGSTPAAMPVLTADLVLESTPAGAQVQIDGSHSGYVTPCTISGLTAGEHTLTLTKPDYVTESRRVQLRAGQRASLMIPMGEHRATVAVSSEPAGASVAVDGRETGRVTPVTLALSKGRHTVAVVKNGYFEASRSFDFNAGQTYEFPFHMTAMGRSEEIREVGKFNKLLGRSDQSMGKVQIRTVPRGAQIMVNGRMMDKVSPAEYLFPAGTYQLMLTQSGYQPIRKTVTIGAGAKIVINEVLERNRP